MEPKDSFKGAEEKILNKYREDAKKRADKLDVKGVEDNLSAWEALANEFADRSEGVLDKDSSGDSGDAANSATDDLPENALGLFFDRYELMGDDYEPESDLEQRDESEVERKMRKLIRDNFISAGRDYFRHHNEEIANKLLLRMAIGTSNSKVFSRNKVTDILRDKIENDRLGMERTKDSSPEGYTMYYGLKLRDYARSIRNGEMVVTPYVAEHLQRVEGNMDSGRPTFLHGHLGSGKTELAITAAKHSAISRAAFEDAVEYCKSHRSSDKQEMRDQLGRVYRQRMNLYSKALHDGDSSAVEQFAPLVISGSKDLTNQDMYIDKTLKLSKFNGKPLLEHKADLDAEIDKWRSEHSEELAQLPEEERAERERVGANHILELYKMKNQAFGTEVEKIEQPLYRAVKEGRPVIIDEVNAIPSAILISMNDILQRKPGQTCYIPGEGQVRIREGFSITMTGNLDSADVVYGGTEELNPAFLSRLDVIEHDYLPMSNSDRSWDAQADPEKNELFQVVMAYLVDRQGNLQLPEMEKSLDKLFALSQLAHESQVIFEGKWRESDLNLSSDSGDEIEPRFEKSVLSIRNVLNVLREWDKGSEKDLDKALWDGYISNMTNPDDQNLMLGLALNYGFFQASDGWQVGMKEFGAGFTSLSEIHPDKFEFWRQPLETLSLMDTVDAVFGPRPERDVYPELSLEELDDLDDEMTFEDIEKTQEKIKEVLMVIDALEVLFGQCGCRVEGTEVAE